MTVYGPVLSWRLGLSLGIDPLGQPKRCPYECIYCQLGPTAVKTVKPASEPYLKPEELFKELLSCPFALEECDYVTFSGVGESTLNPVFAELVLAVRRAQSEVGVDKPVAILTAGATIVEERVQEALLLLDHVEVKIDAVTGDEYALINRPCVSLREYISSLLDWRRKSDAYLAVQTMLLRIRGFSTASLARAKALADLVQDLEADEVHIGTVIRPPAVESPEPVSSEELEEFKEVLAATGALILTPWEGLKRRAEALVRGAREAVLSLASIRPIRPVDVAEILGCTSSYAEKLLESLVMAGLLERTRDGFYRVRR